MEKVHVPLGDRAYDVLIGPGLLAQAGALIGLLLRLHRAPEMTLAFSKAVISLLQRVISLGHGA